MIPESINQLPMSLKSELIAEQSSMNEDCVGRDKGKRSRPRVHCPQVLTLSNSI